MTDIGVQVVLKGARLTMYKDAEMDRWKERLQIESVSKVAWVLLPSRESTRYIIYSDIVATQ